MKHELLKLVYIRKRERKSLVLVACILLFSSFSDDIYLAISAEKNKESTVTDVETVERQEPIPAITEAIPAKVVHEKKPTPNNSPKVNKSQKIYTSNPSEGVPQITRRIAPLERTKAPIEFAEVPIEPAENYELIEIDASNPNVDDLEKLGISKKVAYTWSKYTTAGGKVYDKQGLLKIYGMEEEWADKLEKHIKYSKKEGFPMNAALSHIYINQASAYEFSKISGIGPVLSERIVKFRDNIGGFHSASQLQDVYGIEPELLEKNAGVFLIEQPVTKININTCNESELGAHSYCSYRVAKAIINYRNLHGSFTGPSDFKELRIIDESWVQKISPYLDY